MFSSENINIQSIISDDENTKLIYNYREADELSGSLYKSNYSKAVVIPLIACLRSLQDFLSATSTHLFFNKLRVEHKPETDYANDLDNIFLAITNLHALNEAIENIYDEDEQQLISKTVDYCTKAVALRMQELAGHNDVFFTKYYQKSRLKPFLELNSFTIKKSKKLSRNNNV